MVEEPTTKTDTLENLTDPITGASLKKIRLIHGCISQDERITSRDTGLPQYFDTLDEARENLREQEDFYRRSGYKVWFASFARREGNEYVEINL